MYRLLRNGTVISDSLVVPRSDTSWTYKDSGGASPVTPGTQYTYKLYRVLTNKDSSLIITTPDTSRDNYNFTKTTIGIGQGSIIYSIWGTNPQSLWMAGFIVDSNNGSKVVYNVLHIQNGVTTFYSLLRGSPFYYSVYGLNDSDIYFGGDSILWHWNGTTFDNYIQFYVNFSPIQIGSIGGLWVSPTGDVFCAMGMETLPIEKMERGLTNILERRRRFGIFMDLIQMMYMPLRHGAI